MAHILVIDDSPMIRLFLTLELTHHGHMVVTMADGPSGLRAAHEKSPDLVVLDVQMPGMGGEAVLQQLKTRHPKVPVLFFTVFGDFDRPALADADGCFVKSGDLSALLDAIECLGARTAPQAQARTTTWAEQGALPTRG